MTVEGWILSIDHSVMAVDSHVLIVVRDREGKNLSVKLVLTGQQRSLQCWQYGCL